jgi:hypothetical protein
MWDWRPRRCDRCNVVRSQWTSGPGEISFWGNITTTVRQEPKPPGAAFRIAATVSGVGRVSHLLWRKSVFHIKVVLLSETRLIICITPYKATLSCPVHPQRVAGTDRFLSPSLQWRSCGLLTNYSCATSIVNHSAWYRLNKYPTSTYRRRVELHEWT